MPVDLQGRADAVVEVRARGGADVADGVAKGRLPPAVHEVVVVRVDVREALVVDDAADLSSDDDFGVHRPVQRTTQPVRDAQDTLAAFVPEADEWSARREDPVKLVGVAHLDTFAEAEGIVLQVGVADVIQVAEVAGSDV